MLFSSPFPYVVGKNYDGEDDGIESDDDNDEGDDVR